MGGLEQNRGPPGTAGRVLGSGCRAGVRLTAGQLGTRRCSIYGLQ